jgi:hypothetical protein
MSTTHYVRALQIAISGYMPISARAVIITIEVMYLCTNHLSQIEKGANKHGGARGVHH